MKWFLLAYFSFCFFLFTFFSSGFVDSQDGLQYLAIARRMYYDKTFEMPEARYPEDNIHLSITKSLDGKAYSPTGIGYSLALLPAVAFEDLLYRIAGEKPLSAFPLQHDWPVLLAASMTNAFFGALLVVTIYAYIRTHAVSHWWAVGYSFFGVWATNLFPYVKHVFPHMMFVSFLFLSFYWLRRFSLVSDENRQKKLFLILAAVSYGVVVLAYNPTFLLPLPAVGVYYLLHRFSDWKSILANLQSLRWWKTILIDLILAVISIAPFLMFYWWFNAVRYGGGLQTGYGTGGIPLPTLPPAYVLFEGLWGLLFSPGKSVFLFSPLLVLLITHWYKVTSQWKQEVVAGLVLFFTYLYFMATLLGGVDFLVWHGEASWGPRYMLPAIPLLLLVVVGILENMAVKTKQVLFGVVVLAGLAVNLPMVFLPYQIRFAGLQTDVMISGRNTTVYEYGNMIPRYSPVFTLGKRVVKKIITADRLFWHGDFNLRLLDGFVRPFYLPDGGAWREPKSLAQMAISTSDTNPVSQIEMRFRNHEVVPQSSYAAEVALSVYTQDTQDQSELLSEHLVVLLPGQEEIVVVPVSAQVAALQQDIYLDLKPTFSGTASATLAKKQVIFLQSVHINGLPQPIGTIDYPYVSPISEKLFGAKYTYFGSQNTDPWELWHQHSGVFEETVDIWWLRPFHFWDLPKRFFAGVFILNLAGLSLSFMAALYLSRFSR